MLLVLAVTIGYT